jgi:arginyl-tRNA--protein-N-Asp/Glu arginylyltransferase
MEFREQLVHDALEDCPYLDDQQARMPLRWQMRSLTGEELDVALGEGDRRVGRMLYRTQCPSCSACEPLRMIVDEFQPSKSQRRVWRKNQDIKVTVGPAMYSEERLVLYNRHKLERGLSKDGKEMTPQGYEGWFLRSCVQTVEMCFELNGRLIGVSIVDVGARDTSSVYHFFDPDLANRSLGTFSALVEVAWCQSRGGRYHYLGLYVGGCDQLSYKGRFNPHERRVGGVWSSQTEEVLVE